MAIYKKERVKVGDTIRIVLMQAITRNGVIIGWTPCLSAKYDAAPNYAKQEDVDALNNWKQDQEKEIPDGTIKGIKEVEDFLSPATDNATIRQYSQSILADAIDTMEMDDDNGDITIEYDNGETNNNN